MAFILPTIIAFIVFKQKWVKAVAAIGWLVGLVISVEVWPMYLIGTAIWYPVVVVIASLIKRSKKRYK